MLPHVNVIKLFPAAYEAQLAADRAAEEAAETAGLDPLLVELVKVRASQLNGCAWCLRMHTRDALEKGETTDRLALVAAWWESQYFTPAGAGGPHPRRAGHPDRRRAHCTRPAGRRRGRPRGEAGRRRRPAHARDQHLEPDRDRQPPPGRPLTPYGTSTTVLSVLLLSP